MVRMIEIDKLRRCESQTALLGDILLVMYDLSHKMLLLKLLNRHDELNKSSFRESKPSREGSIFHCPARRYALGF